MYVKLFSSILDSSVWSEDAPTRIMWITMLAMADPEGVVLASLDGLAHRARLEPVDAERALTRLEGPDPNTRDGTDGRRVERIVGGWQIFNYQHYREIRTVTQLRAAARQRRHRAKSPSPPVTELCDTSQQAEAPAPTKARGRNSKNLPPSAGWLTRYLAIYRDLVGTPKAGLIAGVVKAPHDELGEEASLALWQRWCASPQSDFGPAWYGQHWRKAANGGKRHESQTARNLKVLDEHLEAHRGES